MSKELCNDGRCKRVRMGEDRHSSHIERKEKNEKINDEKTKTCNFQKDLAIAQIGATIVASLGSIIIAIGISWIVLSINLGFDALIEDGEKSQFLQIMSKDLFYRSVWVFFIGLGVLIGGVSIFLLKIKKLKCNN